jgi:integrase/recombinase XerD
MPTRLIPTNYRLYIDQHVRINNIQPLTQAEIKQLQDCIKDSFLHLNYKQRQIKQAQLKLVFVLYYACGLRRTEGYNLTIQDIDFDHKTLFIRQGKNYKDRIIPMNKNVYLSLQDYIYNHRNQIKTNHNRLFINNTNTLLKHLKHLQSVCPIQSIKDKTLTLHLLRHSIATHLLQNGMSIENISRFLGHTSLSTTQIYTHIANK